MSVRRWKGWFIASIGGLAAADRDRIAAMNTVTGMVRVTMWGRRENSYGERIQ